MNIDRFSQFEYSEDIENEIWNNCIIVFDTSALLGLYYYSVDSQEKIFSNILEPIRNRLWIPNHVEFEYLKNRKATIKKPVTEKYDEIEKNNIPNFIKDISSIKNTIKDLKQKTSKQDTHPFVNSQLFVPVEETLDSLVKVIDIFSKGISDEIQQRVTEISALEGRDLVLENINKVFNVGSPFSFSRQMEILKESELRFNNEIPPGYRDALGKDKKSGMQRIGDLIIWYQIIEYATSINLPIILVTNDLKEDWCYIKKHSNEVRIDRPREELIQEIWEKAKVKFWMYNFPQFLYTAKRILGFEIDQSVLTEAETEAINRQEEVNPTLKFNGLYAYKPENANYFNLLRFFEDGIIVCVSVSIDNNNDEKSTISNVFTWLDKNWINNGTYSISNNKITFFTKSPNGQVDYEGIILKDSLIINSLSHINGFISENKIYSFLEIQ